MRRRTTAPLGEPDRQLVLWLRFWRPEFGLLLNHLVNHPEEPCALRWECAGELLAHLAGEAVPEDRARGWAADIRWPRVVAIVAETLRDTEVPEAGLRAAVADHMRTLEGLLGVTVPLPAACELSP